MLALTDADLALRRAYAPHYPRIVHKDKIGTLVTCALRGSELSLVCEADVSTMTCKRLRNRRQPVEKCVPYQRSDGSFGLAKTVKYRFFDAKGGGLQKFRSRFDRLVIKNGDAATRATLERVFPELFGPDVGRRRGKGCPFAKAQRNHINAKRARRAAKEG